LLICCIAIATLFLTQAQSGIDIDKFHPVCSAQTFPMAKGTKTKDVIDEQPPSVEEDLYKILGVESNATPEAIKTAYKKNALKHHPGNI
jgi:DnaJ-domain-containing protein 1